MQDNEIMKQEFAKDAVWSYSDWLTCVGVTDYESCGAFSDGLNERPHLSRPQGAVQTNAATQRGGLKGIKSSYNVVILKKGY